MTDTVYIFTHHLFGNWGEYIHYVSASDEKSACLKLFDKWNNRNNFYEIVSLFANYFKLSEDDIGYKSIKHEDDDTIDQSLTNIIKNLNEKYLIGSLDDKQNTIYEMFKKHTEPNIKFKKIKSLEHQMCNIKIDKLNDVLIK